MRACTAKVLYVFMMVLGASSGVVRCGSIGGGLGDALLVADRGAAEALHAVAKAVQGCRVGADEPCS